MQADGALGPDADPGPAVALMAALQGGYLLASTARDVGPMEIALDLALDHSGPTWPKPDEGSDRACDAQRVGHPRRRAGSRR